MKLDWLQDSDYQFVIGLRPPNLVWQLVRRNPEYLKSWAKAKERIGPSHLARNLFILERYGKPWLLEQIIDPELDNPELDVPGLQWTVFPEPIILTRYRAWHDYLSLAHKRKIAVGYDLEKPLTPQFKAVEKDLRKRQKEGKLKVERPSNNNPKWIIYFRILDARADGASYEYIGKVVFADAADDPKKDTCGMAEGAAKRARRWYKPSSYRRILLRS